MGPILCLATAVYFEARSEPLLGQFAVAEVIVNRAESARFPDTICAVVKQDLGPADHDCQFSFYCDGKSDIPREPEAFLYAQLVAHEVLRDTYDGSYAGGALYYHTTGVSPSWSASLPVAAQLGDHIFFSGGEI